MHCPCCKKAELSVIDSRDLDETTIRRRRECSGCHFRFTTYERVELMRMNVKKKDGTLEPYDRDKLTKGIRLAVEKRGISLLQVEQIVNDIERNVLHCCQTAVPTTKIGQAVLKHLKDLDDVAYVRFSSVYKEFSSLQSFEKELKKLKPQVIK